MPQEDFRARLGPKAGRNVSETILGPKHPTNLLFPLYSTGGVLFPYTPTITSGMAAEYDPTSFIHSNYGYNAYVRSFPKPIGISAEFTAQTTDEAVYLLAVIHFFRSVMKMYFGAKPYNRAGTPPPTLLFNYLGQYQFTNVPVVVKSFDYTYDANIDYVPVYTGMHGRGPEEESNMSITRVEKSKTPFLSSAGTDGYTWVPTHLTVSIELDTQYVPIKLRNEFNLDDFRSGKLYNKGYI